MRDQVGVAVPRHTLAQASVKAVRWVRAKKMRPRSDAATDGDRLARVICDGGHDQTRGQPSPALLRAHDSGTYPQADPAGECNVPSAKGRQNSLRYTTNPERSATMS
jgi:hypothetical protein